MNNETWIGEELRVLREKGLERQVDAYARPGGLVRIDNRDFINFSSNDYLGLAGHPHVIGAAEKMLRDAGAGATASRLVTGTLTAHTDLERKLAEFKGYPAALVFGSGYLTNLGVVSALVGRNDCVFADRLAHASIVDAVILSRATLHRFRHNDPAHLEELLKSAPMGGRRLVITESVFSMDGDLAPLADLVSISLRHGAMVMVDEAHATGIFGPDGSGLVGELALGGSVNVSMGTLSKALGGYGGFVACSEVLRRLLVNRSRAFIYTTALPPASAGAALGALRVLEDDPGMGARLLANARAFRCRLKDGGLDTGTSESQIIPIVVGKNEKAMAFSAELRARGIIAVAIRPPTVPEGSARLRLSVTLAHRPEQLDEAADTIVSAAQGQGIV